MKIIARIKTDFKEKFGVPRQSGIVGETVGKIVFEPEYRIPEAIRGIEGYSHLWLIWEFSLSVREEWSPTVRPPRLGGNTRVGVFATRSPYRPNPIGLSSVKLLEARKTEEFGAVLIVSGADLVDGTPIYDIKPYLPFTDSHPEAKAGFAGEKEGYEAEVVFPEALFSKIEPKEREVILALLRHDPHPSYKNDPERVYGMKYGNYEIFFTASEGKIEVKDIK